MLIAWIRGLVPAVVVLCGSGVAAAREPPARDPCATSRECAERGACWSRAGACEPRRALDCQRCEACRDERACFYDPEDGACDNGFDRVSDAQFIAGVVTITIGSAAFAVGSVALIAGWSGSACIDCQNRPPGHDDDENAVASAGAVAMGLGLGATLLFGLPLTISGGKSVARGGSPWTRLEVSPAGLAFVTAL
jgi:hypothetical protein